MPIDDRTTNRAYQLPNAGNWMADDVLRLRSALSAIDADIAARYTAGETEALINGIVNGAPGALNTLQELAAALGNDANFAATVIAQLALKANAAEVYTKGEADARYVQGQTQVEMMFVATEGQTAFNLSTAVINKPSALVTVDGVIQPTSEYSLNQAGTVLTLSEGVPVGTKVRVLVMGVASAGAPADDTVTTQKLRDGAVTAAKLAAGAVSEEKLAGGAVTPAKLAQPLTRMTEQSASGTSVDFLNIPSWARRITVMLNNVSTNQSALKLIQIGSSAGIETSNYDSGAVALTLSGGYDNNNTGFLISVPNNSGESDGTSGALVLTNLSGNTWVAQGSFHATNYLVGNFSSGSKTLAAPFSRIRVTTVNGIATFDAGMINVLYE